MRTYETVQVPASEEERVAGVRCDICGSPAEVVGSWARLPAVGDVAVRMTVGVADRDGGGYARTVEFDICPACFEAHLVPALRALGAAPIEREVEH